MLLWIVPILVHFDGRVKSETYGRGGKIGLDQSPSRRLSSYYMQGLGTVRHASSANEVAPHLRFRMVCNDLSR
jgi:hypothetical protein